jgi:hypothetical protein
MSMQHFISFVGHLQNLSLLAYFELSLENANK